MAPCRLVCSKAARVVHDRSIDRLLAGLGRRFHPCIAAIFSFSTHLAFFYPPLPLILWPPLLPPCFWTLSPKRVSCVSTTLYTPFRNPVCSLYCHPSSAQPPKEYQQHPPGQSYTLLLAYSFTIPRS